LRARIAKAGTIVVIPNNPSRSQKLPFEHYKERYLIECFSKLKHFRRVATRYEKTPELPCNRNYRRNNPMDQVTVHTI
jgi:putative transposase